MSLILRRSLIFFMLMVAGLVLYAFWFGNRADRFDETAVPYLQLAIPAVASWNYDELAPLLSPAARRDFENENMRAAYREFDRLGELRSMEKPQYLADSTASSESLGEVQVLEYQVELEFDTGPATIKVKLISTGSSYYLHHFGFHSAVFAAGQ